MFVFAPPVVQIEIFAVGARDIETSHLCTIVQEQWHKQTFVLALRLSML
jgi:hypothetical protein